VHHEGNWGSFQASAKLSGPLIRTAILHLGLTMEKKQSAPASGTFVFAQWVTVDGTSVKTTGATR
jgi:hypothetical protein